MGKQALGLVTNNTKPNNPSNNKMRQALLFLFFFSTPLPFPPIKIPTLKSKKIHAHNKY